MTDVNARANTNDFLAASGLIETRLENDEEPSVVIERIETLAYAFVDDLVHGRLDGGLTMIRRTSTNALEDALSGALHLGDKVSIRRFNDRSAVKMSQLFEVFTVIHRLLHQGKRISQRELFYLLIDSFKNQEQLNDTILDASATLGVPRFVLNIGAATRGALAGCLRLATAGSLYQVDCEYVGTVRPWRSTRSSVFLSDVCSMLTLLHALLHTFHVAQNGWPIPGDVRAASSLVVHSTARYIIGTKRNLCRNELS